LQSVSHPAITAKVTARWKSPALTSSAATTMAALLIVWVAW
jgi:hypothetical protein